MYIITYWSEELSAYRTKRETVAQFRKRLDIADEPPKFVSKSNTTLWESLTVYKQNIEKFLSPRQFGYSRDLHRPYSTDLGNTIDNTLQENKDRSSLIHFFYPTNHSESITYAYENSNNVISENRQVPDYNLPFLEQSWGIYLDQLVSQARLRIPTSQNDFHFFFE